MKKTVYCTALLLTAPAPSVYAHNPAKAFIRGSLTKTAASPIPSSSIDMYIKAENENADTSSKKQKSLPTLKDLLSDTCCCSRKTVAALTSLKAQRSYNERLRQYSKQPKTTECMPFTSVITDAELETEINGTRDMAIKAYCSKDTTERTPFQFSLYLAAEKAFWAYCSVKIERGITETLLKKIAVQKDSPPGGPPTE